MKKIRYFVILGVILADSLVKLLVRRTMYCGQTIPVIEGFLNLTYVQNRGVAFSLFSGRGNMIMVITFLALCVAVWYMEKHKDNHWTLLVALELIISGGAGNLVDRAALGYVTDMFDFHFWPVFNIADIAICAGCIFLVIYMFVFDKESAAGE